MSRADAWVFLPRRDGLCWWHPRRGGKYSVERRRSSDLGPRHLQAREVRGLRSGPSRVMEDGRPAHLAGRRRPASIGKPLRGGWNHQFLTDLDFVGIVQVVGLGDDGILVGVAV